MLRIWKVALFSLVELLIDISSTTSGEYIILEREILLSSHSAIIFSKG